MFALARQAGRGSNEEAAVAHLRTWDHWKARGRLGAVQTPTLIICGDNDRSTHPDLSIEMWKAIPDARLFIAPNAGHAVHVEYPVAFNSLVGSFLMQALRRLRSGQVPQLATGPCPLRVLALHRFRPRSDSGPDPIQAQIRLKPRSGSDAQWPTISACQPHTEHPG
jgi:hypothetical protein